MRYLPLLLIAAVGCIPAEADKPPYVPPKPSDIIVDPIVPEPAETCDNPACLCEDCTCDPCQCGSGDPEPIPEYTMREGYTLSLLTAEWCVNCPEAKTAAYESGVPVEVVDIDADRERAIEIWGGVSPPDVVPSWVLSRDGENVKWWWGASNQAGVKIMAEWTPPVSNPEPVPVQTYQQQPVIYQQPVKYQPPQQQFYGGGCPGGRCGW